MLGFWTPGPMEMLIIGFVAVLVFGKNLPKMISGMGKSIREFREGLREGKE